MIFTGFSDEAGASIDTQISAVKKLGWDYLELRSADGTNIDEMTDEQFAPVLAKIKESGIKISCLASTIANWNTSLDESFDKTVEKVDRIIPRMKQLGTKYIRIMSYALYPGKEAKEQNEDERVRRLRILVKMFKEHDLMPLHENCATYGGMGWQYTLKLINQVPGLRLIFDTGNQSCKRDYSVDDKTALQSSWVFYEHVKEHIEYIHIKDGNLIKQTDKVFNDVDYTFPGEGEGDVKKIIADLKNTGYQGFVSIEPHMETVYHAPEGEQPDTTANADKQFQNFVEYGEKLQQIVKNC